MSKKALPTILVLILILVSLIGFILLSKNNPQTATQTGTNPTQTASEVNQASGQEVIPVGQTTTPPIPPSQQELPLSVIFPANGSVFTDSSLIVKGNTSPKAEVFVNDKETAADAQGNFSVTLTLEEGENMIVVLVNDVLGNSSEKELTVTYDNTQIK